jgi:hypothetical protein
VGEEQLRAVEFHLVRDVPALTRAVDGLHHRLLRADALQHLIGADALDQLHDTGRPHRRRARRQRR